MNPKLKHSLVVILAAIGAVGIVGSWVAIGITYGFGTRDFFPFYLGGLVLMLVAIAISRRISMGRVFLGLLAVTRWLVALPLLLSVGMLIVGWVQFSLIEGQAVSGADQWFIVYIVSLLVLLWPELAWAWKRAGLTARSNVDA